MEVTSRAYVRLQDRSTIAGGHVLNLKNLLSGGLLPNLKLRMYKGFRESSPQCSIRNSVEDNGNLWFHHCLSKLGKDVAYVTWTFPNLHMITVANFLSDELVKTSQPPGLSSAATGLVIFSVPRYAAVCLCWLLSGGFKEPQQLKQHILRTFGSRVNRNKLSCCGSWTGVGQGANKLLAKEGEKKMRIRVPWSETCICLLIKVEKSIFLWKCKNVFYSFYRVMSKHKECLLLNY